MVNVICMRWGTVYGPHYVNRLYAMVRRHLSQPFRFVCLTDSPDPLHPDIETRPIPEVELPGHRGQQPWRKLALFTSPLADLEGPTLFLDIDLIIVDSLDPLFEHPGQFCIIENWTQMGSGVGNSSVFRFEAGQHGYVLDTFRSKPFEHWYQTHTNEQTVVSRTVKEVTFWPADWCVSFKHSCLPGGIGGWKNWVWPAGIPQGARIVVFHGHPNPDEAAAGRWPGGPHKHLRAVPWIAQHWHDNDLP